MCMNKHICAAVTVDLDQSGTVALDADRWRWSKSCLDSHTFICILLIHRVLILVKHPHLYDILLLRELPTTSSRIIISYRNDAEKLHVQAFIHQVTPQVDFVHLALRRQLVLCFERNICRFCFCLTEPNGTVLTVATAKISWDTRQVDEYTLWVILEKNCNVKQKKPGEMLCGYRCSTKS